MKMFFADVTNLPEKCDRNMIIQFKSLRREDSGHESNGELTDIEIELIRKPILFLIYAELTQPVKWNLTAAALSSFYLNIEYRQ